MPRGATRLAVARRTRRVENPSPATEIDSFRRVTIEPTGEPSMERRTALRQIAHTSALAMAGGLILPRGASAALDRTPGQAEGPYYPVEKPRDVDWNLLRNGAQASMAGGEPLGLGGRVLGADGKPLAGAVVEIWQCDHRGNYNHPRAPGRAGFDPTFQGYGEARTDGDGRYRFLTIVPVPYATRPPHIHVKVRAAGRDELTTQLYIRNHPENGRDGIFSSLVFPGKDRLMMDLRGARLDGGLGGKAATFDFVV
jgi:protocatechuate 3,4-dioxygenase beta subunit